MSRSWTHQPKKNDELQKYTSSVWMLKEIVCYSPASLLTLFSIELYDSSLLPPYILSPGVIIHFQQYGYFHRGILPTLHWIWSYKLVHKPSVLKAENKEEVISYLDSWHTSNRMFNIKYSMNYHLFK